MAEADNFDPYGAGVQWDNQEPQQVAAINQEPPALNRPDTEMPQVYGAPPQTAEPPLASPRAELYQGRPSYIPDLPVQTYGTRPDGSVVVAAEDRPDPRLPFGMSQRELASMSPEERQRLLNDPAAKGWVQGQAAMDMQRRQQAQMEELRRQNAKPLTFAERTQLQQLEQGLNMIQQKVANGEYSPQEAAEAEQMIRMRKDPLEARAERARIRHMEEQTQMLTEQRAHLQIQDQRDAAFLARTLPERMHQLEINGVMHTFLQLERGKFTEVGTPDPITPTAFRRMIDHHATDLRKDIDALVRARRFNSDGSLDEQYAPAWLQRFGQPEQGPNSMFGLMSGPRRYSAQTIADARIQAATSMAHDQADTVRGTSRAAERGTSRNSGGAGGSALSRESDRTPAPSGPIQTTAQQTNEAMAAIRAGMGLGNPQPAAPAPARPQTPTNPSTFRAPDTNLDQSGFGGVVSN